MFLHGGFMHLFGNMLFLWIYGDNVERRLGAIPYLFGYLATGVAATLTHALVFSSSEMPLVGASGAISGVLGFYFLWFPRNTVRMLVFLPPFLMQVFEIPARFVLGMYLRRRQPAALPLRGRGRGRARRAHRRLRRRRRSSPGSWTGAASRRGRPTSRRRRRRRRAPTPCGPPSPTAGYDDAARAYFALPRAAARGALSADEAVELASWLRGPATRTPRSAAAARGARRPAGRGLAEVYALAGTILLEDRREPTAAYQYLLTALELGPGRRPRPPCGRGWRPSRRCRSGGSAGCTRPRW